MEGIQPIIWNGTSLQLLDQRFLPDEERYVECRTLEDIQECIKKMVVRGAPAIGVTAAYGLLLAARQFCEGYTQYKKEDSASFMPEFLNALESAGSSLKATRPTAVNLSWGVDRVLSKIRSLSECTPPAILKELEDEARLIFEEDIAVNKKIGAWGATLIGDNYTILTHCNAGALATAGYGTALGVIRSAFYQGKKITVYADETRPFLQGSRLTVWELQKEGIPCFLIVDAAAGYYINKGEVNCIIVGADRIAANGDVANKIGTYPLAVLAKENDVPFYVAAPFSTVDMSVSSGKEIIVEEREPEEITTFRGLPLSPQGVKAKNPAFDITPAKLISALITEYGILHSPNEEKMKQLARKRGELFECSGEG